MEGGAQYPFPICSPGTTLLFPLVLAPHFFSGRVTPAPPTPPRGNYIIPTEGELSREARFATDPLGGAANNGRSALPGPVCAEGAFHWPQRRRRRHMRRAVALAALRWPCWGSLRGPSWAWTTSGGRGRVGSPAAPRAERPARSLAGRQPEGLGYLAGQA